MGVEPPFLYDPPSTYPFNDDPLRPFNPKAVSQASLISAASRSRPRPKQEGPLVSFNRHPDSYLVLPVDNNAKPLSKGTKHTIQKVRWLQLFLRMLQLLGAVGALFCVIVIKNTGGAVGWIIRVPPCVAIVHLVYAIFHLSRPSKARTAQSSASYHVFSLITDIGLIPFYVILLLMSKTQYDNTADKPGKWSTFFNDATINHKIIFSTFLLSIANCGLHFISIFVALYLAIVFRRIAKLPPDMNPLEDNLTSRHKKKSSNASSMTEKRLSQSTISSSPRHSKAISQTDVPLLPTNQSIPFMHTRTNSNETSSPTSPGTASASPHGSRADLPSQIYRQNVSARSSRADLHRSRASNNTSPVRRQSPSQRTSRSDFSRPTRSSSRLAAKRNSGYSSPRRPPSPEKQPEDPSDLHDNWYVVNTSDDEQDHTQPPHHHQGRAGRKGEYERIDTLASSQTQPEPDENTNPHGQFFAGLTAAFQDEDLKRLGNSQYHALSQDPLDHGDLATAHGYPFDESLVPDPLSMNSPTPPPHRVLTPASANRASAADKKDKYYPNLNAGTKPSSQLAHEGNARVVSSSGADVLPAAASSRLGRRDVSGKVAEEGRGGDWAGPRNRKFSFEAAPM
ncbi:hypothetical protein L228DRAFT_282161 [Xylona heveae TC161]|uniref:Uncharacterized protein n=1 Tax=Xylona heveae (strain CBS 132557 / TC161) TaxID=1328760 RepID=A0A165HFG6_XYLHT|nr:hypothetical protein L228DRAFT_282161 [Xylona heveae TC161]KZF23432.1 hypothetical protein L228DRAFT_282161 [Xylona heveae TC161]